MPDEHILTLRQADQARTDFAAVESDLEFIMAQLARIPTRTYRFYIFHRIGARRGVNGNKKRY
jgi:hypothetical protein